MRRLDAATDWTTARRRLYEVHRAVHDDVIVIPLWQTVDYCAYADTVRGIGTQPLTLYQNVENWKVHVPEDPE